MWYNNVNLSKFQSFSWNVRQYNYLLLNDLEFNCIRGTGSSKTSMLLEITYQLCIYLLSNWSFFGKIFWLQVLWYLGAYMYLSVASFYEPACAIPSWRRVWFLQGMVYIHEGPLRYHGRLRSSNVLVDGRWTCKVADVGLHKFRAGEHKPSESDPAYYYSEAVFFIKFWQDISPFLWDRWYPRVRIFGDKAQWIPHLHVLFPVCNGFIRFTSGATPADLLRQYYDWHSSLIYAESSKNLYKILLLE